LRGDFHILVYQTHLKICRLEAEHIKTQETSQCASGTQTHH